MFFFLRKELLWQYLDLGIENEYGVKRPWVLKSAQELAVYAQLMHLRGQVVAEIGGGNSRILPALARHNRCTNIEKFEGRGGGPVERFLQSVKAIPAYVGDFDPVLKDETFDVVFSISVVEHVSDLEAFHKDQLRILKPGGFFLHAIDVYLKDTPSAGVDAKLATYRSWLDGLEPLGEVYQESSICSASFVTNPDITMHRWGRIAPKLIELRKVAQACTLMVGGRKR